jgi:hypothetical protein
MKLFCNIKTKFLFNLFLIFLFSNRLLQENCDKLNDGFATYQDAIYKVRSSKFKIRELASTPSSSWIKRIEYYSCDGKNGYLIIVTNGKEYIHSFVPLIVWKNFKSAKSVGSFYNANIKGRYRLNLTN